MFTGAQDAIAEWELAHSLRGLNVLIAAPAKSISLRVTSVI